jgi:hypothetical protein
LWIAYFRAAIRKQDVADDDCGVGTTETTTTTTTTTTTRRRRRRHDDDDDRHGTIA